MKRILAAATLSLIVSACGGSSPSPTGPTVTPPPTPTTRVIGLSGNLAFGDIAAGSTATSVVTIANAGTGILTVTGMSAPSAASGIYKASWVSGTIPRGASQAITVTFAPAAAISYNGTFTVNADQTSGTNSVPISGAGSAASRVSLAGVVTSDGGERLSGVTLRILDGANAGQDRTEQRRLLEIVLSNCTFDRGSLSPTYNSPFDLLVRGNQSGNWRRGWDSFPANPLTSTT